MTSSSWCYWLSPEKTRECVKMTFLCWMFPEVTWLNCLFVLFISATIIHSSQNWVPGSLGKPLLKTFQGQRTTEHVGSNQDQEAYSLGLRQDSGDVVTVSPSIHSVGTWADLTPGKQELIFYADNEVWLTCQYGGLLLLMEAGWLQKDIDYLQKWPQLFLFAVWFFSFPIKHPFPNPLSLSWPHHLFWPNIHQSWLCSPSRCNKMWPTWVSLNTGLWCCSTPLERAPTPF